MTDDIDDNVDEECCSIVAVTDNARLLEEECLTRGGADLYDNRITSKKND